MITRWHLNQALFTTSPYPPFLAAAGFEAAAAPPAAGYVAPEAFAGGF